MKNFLMKTIMHFLYRGIKVLNGRDSQVTKEISALPDGYTILLSTDINKPKQICFGVFNGKVKKVKNSGKIDLEIRFKNKHLAYNVFMGKVSVSDAYAMHYFQMFGNIFIAMGVTRIIERVEGYLFPKFINKKLLKRPFKREISIFKTYLLCIF